MPKNKTISDELKFIGPFLAASTPGHPFEVPEGYFEEFSKKLLVRIKSVPGERAPAFASEKVDHPFIVPDGYFADLPANILNRVKNADPISVSAEIESLSPLLSNLNKSLPFSLPDGYFEDMPSNVVAGIQAIDFVQTELEILPQSLEAVRKINVFSVPAGYFEQLPQQIVKKVHKPGKVVQGNFGRKFVRMAAAAAVLAFVAVSGWLYTRNNNGSLASNGVSAEVDSSIHKISTAEIVNYVNNNAIALPEPVANATDVQPDDMKEMLANVSDEEIRDYLTANGISSLDQTN